MQHLAFKKPNNNNNKNSLTDQDYTRGDRSNFERRTSRQQAKNVLGHLQL